MSSAAGVHGVKQNLVGNSISRVMDCEVAVIGAGPYGLAAAAHLKSKGIEVRVFGRPMEFWADKMPAGMLLRSPRVASNISDPKGAFSLEAFETAAKIGPQAPLPLETFVAYGQWFQTQLIPDLDQREVTSLNRTHNGFELALEDGIRIHCHRVVVATGIGSFQRIPEVFQKVTGGKVSHCYAGCDVPGFANKRVAVIGAGQSALECAALLQEAGANVEVIARTPALKWIGMHQWLHKLGPVSSMLYSQHDVGPCRNQPSSGCTESGQAYTPQMERQDTHTGCASGRFEMVAASALTREVDHRTFGSRSVFCNRQSALETR